MKMRWLILPLIVALLIACGGCVGTQTTAGPATVEAPQGAAEAPVPLPNANGSLKFVVLGDFGTGGPGQYELAAPLSPKP